MQTITVSRNDEIYEAFADVAQAADGTLVCTYRESMGHSSRPFSRVIVRRSFDRGLTWSPRQVVVERTEARFAFLDNDRALSADSGYSGWVQLPNGTLYVVNYITDDAPRAHIRGYVVGREDWYLFPEGAIRANHPLSKNPHYYDKAQQMALEQQRWVDGQDWSRRVPTQK